MVDKKPKVLLIAHACSPFSGSENAVGWSAVVALAKENDLTVVTSARSAEDLRRAAKESLLPSNVTVHPVGCCRSWHANRMVARLQSWIEYYRWMWALPKQVHKLMERQAFDIVHHVTYTSWRVPNPLVHLPIPFIWGPIGGVAKCPRPAYSLLSTAGRCFELARNTASWLASQSRALRSCVKSSAVLVAANEETRRFLLSLGAAPERIEALSPAVFSPEQIERFARYAGTARHESPIRLFAGGNLIGTKGVSLALRALANITDLPFLYTIAGGGPEEQHLKVLARKLGLWERVRFHPGFTGDEYARELGRSHIVLLPSFREIAGITLMEAMLAGCVPVVAAASAHGEIVTEECGVAVPLDSMEIMAESMAREIRLLSSDPSRMRSLGMAASQKIAERFSQEHYEQTMRRIYNRVQPGSVTPARAVKKLGSSTD